VPAEPVGWSFQARARPETLLLVLTPPKAWRPLREARFFPARPGVIDHGAPQTLAREGGGYRLQLAPAANAARPPESLTGVLVARRDGGQTRAFRVDATTVRTLGGSPPPTPKEDKR
jgi:hypothetical protein